MESDQSQRLMEPANESQTLMAGSNQSQRGCWTRTVAYMGTAVSFVLGIIVLVLVFRYSNKDGPYSTMEEFDVFALDKATNTTNNHTIHYYLMFNYRGKKNIIYYDALNLTFYYKPNNTELFPIGVATFPSFRYAGYFFDTDHMGNIEPTGAFWENATAAVSTKGSAVFRVELVTAYRYDMVFWKGKRHSMVVGANLHVNDHGKLVKSKIFHMGIELTSSGAGKSMVNFGLWRIVGILFILSFFCL